MKIFHTSKFACFKHSRWTFITSLIRVLFVNLVNPFMIQLHYFVILSLVGFMALEVSKTRTQPSFKPSYLDMFFTSVSAVTVSSMSTVEMEVFSNTQLLIMTVLMFLGGEVFVSMVGLQLKRSMNNGELGFNSSEGTEFDLDGENPELIQTQIVSNEMRYKTIKCLSYVILCYLLISHVIGASLVYMYLSFIKMTKELLRQRGIRAETFSIFTVVSTFANCGFIPTNENMAVFAENSGLLLIFIPLALMGNTMYPVFLRVFIWFLWKITRKEEFGFLLNKEDVRRDLGYDHLFPRKRTFFLGATVLGFLLIQFVLFCSMEWTTRAMQGLGSFQKLVASLFEVVSPRHTGESIVDLSIVSPAILVLFLVMMYLPPYTSFLPIEEQEKLNMQMMQNKRSNKLIDTILFSNLSYLLIFIILICISERESMKMDPLNFNAFNITLEVISAYGNVGFSMGYSCKRRIYGEGLCIEKLYGFAGKWSNKGKIMLILVMFFGRLKSFTRSGGRAWILA